MDYKTKLTLTGVKVQYPIDLEKMINMFRICATARLFLPDMFPEEDAGIFLDTDMILHDDIVHLWDHFKQFDLLQFAGMALVETSYGMLQSGGVHIIGNRQFNVK